VLEVARALVAAADAAMARALRRVSVERGVDPRGLVLVAFGGGGHCTRARSPSGWA
jgi:N-methylhydantoinase A